MRAVQAGVYITERCTEGVYELLLLTVLQRLLLQLSTYVTANHGYCGMVDTNQRYTSANCPWVLFPEATCTVTLLELMI